MLSTLGAATSSTVLVPVALTDFAAVAFALIVLRPVVFMPIFIRARARAAKKFSRVNGAKQFNAKQFSSVARRGRCNSRRQSPVTYIGEMRGARTLSRR